MPMVETIVFKPLLHKIARMLNFRMEWKLKMKRQSEQYQNEIDKL